MKIAYAEIMQFLEGTSVSFKIFGNPKDEYVIASIFAIVKNGFYFLEDFSREIRFENSIVLHNSSLNEKAENGNCFIKINESPQELYYKIIDFYFKEVSTGKIDSTAKIHPEAIIGNRVQIDAFTVVGNCRIGDDSIIRSQVVINDNCEIGNKVIIESNSTLGATGIAWVNDNTGERIRLPQLGGVLIENNVILGANSVVVRGSLNEYTKIGKSTFIAPGARIGHGCIIGKNVHFANNVILGGNVTIGDSCFLGSGAILRTKVKLHLKTTVAAGAVVIRDTTKDSMTLIGVPAKENLTKALQQGVPKSNTL